MRMNLRDYLCIRAYRCTSALYSAKSDLENATEVEVGVSNSTGSGWRADMAE